MIVSKTYKAGIDTVIDYFQVKLYPNLLAYWDSNAVYTCYPRANRNYKKDDIIPEISLDKKEYESTLFNDKVSVNSFFLPSASSEWVYENNEVSHDLSIIFQADLVKLYGSDERADERFKIDVLKVLKRDWKYKIGDIDIEEGIDLVYNKLSFSNEFKEKIKTSDLSHKYVVKFTFNVVYSVGCSAQVTPVCLPVGIIKDGILIERVSAGDDYEYSSVCADANVTVNSEDFGTVTSGGDFDVNVVDEDGVNAGSKVGSLFIVPFSQKIIYERPDYTGQLGNSGSPWVVGDSLYRKLNEIGKITQPTIGRQARTAFGTAHLLESPNRFLNNYVITGTSGGYYNPDTGLYYTVAHVETDRATAFPNDIGVNHLMSYLFQIKETVSTNQWATQIGIGLGLTIGTFSTWYLPSTKEFYKLASNGVIAGFRYDSPPLDFNPTTKLTSDTYVALPTSAWAITTVTQITPTPKANNNGAVFCKMDLNINDYF